MKNLEVQLREILEGFEIYPLLIVHSLNVMNLFSSVLKITFGTRTDYSRFLDKFQITRVCDTTGIHLFPDTLTVLLLGNEPLFQFQMILDNVR